jgi:hypothetical protein
MILSGFRPDNRLWLPVPDEFRFARRTRGLPAANP